MNIECTIKNQARTFTLVELLIVIAIIAILASIAIPNFLEAQKRAKVSRALSDMRTIATALETHAVDRNKYPKTDFDGVQMESRAARLNDLTTPIAYITTIPLEVFSRDEKEPYAYWSVRVTDDMKFSPMFFYIQEEKDRRGRWSLFSRGPDIDYEAAPEESGTGLLVHYDATNGTVSNGDIMRFGP